MQANLRRQRYLQAIIGTNNECQYEILNGSTTIVKPFRIFFFIRIFIFYFIFSTGYYPAISISIMRLTKSELLHHLILGMQANLRHQRYLQAIIGTNNECQYEILNGSTTIVKPFRIFFFIRIFIFYFIFSTGYYPAISISIMRLTKSELLHHLIFYISYKRQEKRHFRT